MLHEEKNKSKTNEKLKSESVMLSRREANKLNSSSHQQEASKENAVEGHEVARKLHADSHQQNTLLHGVEQKQIFSC